MLVRDVCSHSFNRIIIKTSPLFLVLPTLTMVRWGGDKAGETIGGKKKLPSPLRVTLVRLTYAFLHTDISRCLETNMIFETHQQ